MHKGHVREVGTHQELLQRRGIYYRLYELQYKDQEVVAGHNTLPVVGPGEVGAADRELGTQARDV